MAIKFFTVLIVFILSTISIAQNNLNVSSLFGIQYKPIMAGEFVGRSTTSLNTNNFATEFKQQLGHSYGANIRLSLTPKISLETGIHLVRRNYSVNFNLRDSNLQSSKSLSFYNYDLPAIPYIFIKLSDKIFLANGIGPVFVFSMSDVATQEVASNSIKFIAEGRRTHRFAIDLSTNLGFELRTDKNGVFYIGGNARIPFAPIFTVAGIAEIKSNTTKKVIIGNMSGTYISFELRYYFPSNKNKQEEILKGPID